MKDKHNNKMINQSKKLILWVMLILISLILGFYTNDVGSENNCNNINVTTVSVNNLKDIPKYENAPYITINNNVPNFSEQDYTTKSFEIYSELDSLGRCGVAYANICKEIMPIERTETRKY